MCWYGSGFGGSGALSATLENISNPGGNIDLVAGTGISIASDDILNNITISAVGAPGQEVMTVLTNGTGVQINQGEFVYVSSANTISLADASSIGTGRVAGAVETNIPPDTSGDVTISGVIENAAKESGHPLFTPGNPVFLSEEPGKCTQTAPGAPGTTIYELGYAKNSNDIIFIPRMVLIN